MISRRRFVQGALAVPALLGLARPALAAPRPGQVRRGRPLHPHGGGPLPALYPYAAIKLGRAQPIRRAALFAIANANDRYAASIATRGGAREQLYLTVAAGAVPASSWGDASVFNLDRATADEVAALLRVPRRDRTPLGAGLFGTWRAVSQPFTIGQPMPIALTIAHTGGDPVAMTVGGRQRGPRDNRFAFTATDRAGHALPVIDAPDFGGVMAYRPLVAGDRVELTADLRDWVAITAPGTYAITCQHQVVLAPTTAGAPWPDHAHEAWDLTLAGALTITVA